MKPDIEDLARQLSEIDEGLIREHLDRLPERYFDLFRTATVCDHLRALARLQAENPGEVLFSVLGGGKVEITVLAFDYPGEFSLITGLLSASGFNILSGDIFTYRARPALATGGPQQAAPPDGRAAGDAPRRDLSGQRRGRRPLRGPAVDPLRRRRIIDHFSGTVSDQVPLEVWEHTFRHRLSEALLLLERGDGESQGRARQRINELVAARLSSLRLRADAVLYPVEIQVTEGGAGEHGLSGEPGERDQPGRTVLRVVAQDTPAFLYALSTALALRGIFIDYIRIRTVHNRIEDEFSFLDAQGRPIASASVLDQVRLSVLLTKQFTYFLGAAPDPYAALCRFEQLVEGVLELPDQGRWHELLSNPMVLRDLARLLGASDHLWEDFIRLQYESLLPVLEPHVRGRGFATGPQEMERRLAESLAGAVTLEDARRRLNEFKDREIFLLELDHIVGKGEGFPALSRGLTRLAEAVVGKAVELTYGDLVARFGTPQTVAGLEAALAILGLGKLGGGDLGYASDIELLFVYSDSGTTAGRPGRPAEGGISNGEFFGMLVREACGSIRTKKEGIFRIDLRLRPYGAAGPAACSLESFCRYYGPKGEAHALERLALVRLRAIGGKAAAGLRLAGKVERLRDEMLYAGGPPDIAALRAARLRQLDDRTRKGELNAKLSPGALADLEYTVMLLQLLDGAGKPQLRTPFMHEALERLGQAGILAPREAARLREAYEFLRALINGLRMLRGNAEDLFLPVHAAPEGFGESDEYLHLARRMGYGEGAEQPLSPSQRLHMDFETHTAFVRAFVERHLGREALSGPRIGNVADLVLSESLPGDLETDILRRAGFRQPARAKRNLRGIAAAAGEPARLDFARLAVLAADLLQSQPDPDMALNNWERFVRALPRPVEHLRLLAAQPRRLEILLAVFAGSQYLSDALIRSPEVFEWATGPARLLHARGVAEMRQDVEARAAASDEAWRRALRAARNRELVRLGIRDICLGVSIEEIMSELSSLADALIQVELERCLGRVQGQQGAGEFCLVAFGKLGGRELNYSSDIDLLAVSAGPLGALEEQALARLMAELRQDLSGHTGEGYVYRVDLRLRPYGSSGELISPLGGLERYYREKAALWEIQALLRARPVAGSHSLSQRFTEMRERVLPERMAKAGPRAVVAAIDELRVAARRRHGGALQAGPNIKLDSGGIRDLEFLVQGIQLLHLGAGQAGLLSGNTLEALGVLEAGGWLPPAAAEQLRRDYRFLRRIEHYLQVFEDRQTHTLPVSAEDLQALARRMLGRGASAGQFREQLESVMVRVREAYDRLLLGAPGPGSAG